MRGSDVDAQSTVRWPIGVEANVARAEPVFQHRLNVLLLNRDQGQDEAALGKPAHRTRIVRHALGRPVFRGGGTDRKHAHAGDVGADEMFELVQRHLIGCDGEQATVGVQMIVDSHRRKVRGCGARRHRHVDGAQVTVAV